MPRVERRLFWNICQRMRASALYWRRASVLKGPALGGATGLGGEVGLLGLGRPFVPAPFTPALVMPAPSMPAMTAPAWVRWCRRLRQWPETSVRGSAAAPPQFLAGSTPRPRAVHRASRWPPAAPDE